MSKPEHKLTADLLTSAHRCQTQEFINDFKVTETKELSKTVLLIIASFPIISQVFLWMKKAQLNQKPYFDIHYLILHLHTVSRENSGEPGTCRHVKM